MWQLLAFTFCLIPAVLGEGDCSIKLANDKNSKIYFNIFQWTQPKHNLGSNVTSVKNKAFIQLVCNNGFARDELIAKEYTFQCTDGKFNKTLGYEDLLCRSTYHKLTKTSQISPIEFGSKIFKCSQDGWQAFQVKAVQTDGTSKLLYTTCLDTSLLRTKFVFQPRRKPTSQVSNDTRRDVWGLDRFGKSAYERLKLTEGYVASIQQNRITAAFPERYNKSNKYPYTFNRGHLAPYADFIETEDRKASCLYINIAPQWSSFNSNSWLWVERQTRNLVQSNPFNWEIYTGTYGSISTSKGSLFVSPLYDKNGNYIKSYVPVPKLYWKVVYNVVDKNKSKVFIGVNNPELKSPAEFSKEYLVCKPLSDENGNKFHGSSSSGFVYQCELEEFLEKMKTDEKIVK